jgi:hypothetical protein
VPTLPLYNPSPTHPDGWHRVAAPGGYEIWHFDAEDSAADVRVVVKFSQGSPALAEYRSRYSAFIRNPTRNEPPVPADFPSVQFAVYEKGRLVASFLEKLSRDQFAASDSEADVRAGANRVLVGAGGTLALTLLGGSTPSANSGKTAPLAADLWFAPRLKSPPAESAVFSREWSGADHRWIIANPLCDVSGTIRIANPGEAPREIRFAGRGHHDHRYGSGPLGGGSQRWMWGRILGEDQAHFFQLANPRDKAHAPEFRLIVADPAGIREVKRDASPSPAWSRKASGSIAYPDTIDLGQGWWLRSPTVVDSSATGAWIVYETSNLGRRGTGFCEVGIRV